MATKTQTDRDCADGVENGLALVEAAAVAVRSRIMINKPMARADSAVCQGPGLQTIKEVGFAGGRGCRLEQVQEPLFMAAETLSNDCDHEPSAEPRITPARAPLATIEVDGLRIPEYNNKEPTEHGSSNRPIMIPDIVHETSSGQEYQVEDIRISRKQPASFHYPPGFFQPGIWDVEDSGAKNTREIASHDRNPVENEISHRVCEVDHRQLDSVALEPSEPKFLDIDDFNPDNTYERIPTDSQMQLCVREPIINQSFSGIRTTTVYAELEAEDALRWDTLDDEGNPECKNALSSCFISAAVVPFAPAVERPDAMTIQTLRCQHEESQARIDTDGISASESTRVAGDQAVMGGGQDDREHEIDDIIGKEEINGEVYYWVDWTPTLMPSSELRRATDLIGNFEARLPAQRRHAKGQRKQPKSNRGRQAIVKPLPAIEKPQRLLQLLAAVKQAQPSIQAEIQKPKRGRPRKQK
ncbi:MAG: hypothetical protein Q9187_007250 [Circinaria calcarea]